ncbi:LytR/AlgR family response regulator transcription factor [Lewinella sp. LCG006]|uniref:LytR/AlgR family response regulator transcription factor n=1 Tax=Lewinella sp. LCG006 TaxID=3231911 RepID=UPI00346043F0
MSTIFNEFLFLKRKGVYEKVAISDIMFLQVSGDYVSCCLKTEELFIIRISLNKLSELLAPFGFMRIHRSFLIQLSLIESISFQEDFITISRHQIPINRNSKRKLGELITKLE